MNQAKNPFEELIAKFNMFCTNNKLTRAVIVFEAPQGSGIFVSTQNNRNPTVADTYGMLYSGLQMTRQRQMMEGIARQQAQQEDEG